MLSNPITKNGPKGTMFSFCLAYRNKELGNAIILAATTTNNGIKILRNNSEVVTLEKIGAVTKPIININLTSAPPIASL